MAGIMDVGGQCSGIGTFPLLIRGGLLNWIGHLDELLCRKDLYGNLYLELDYWTIFFTCSIYIIALNL